jgi:mono/diheme cytochrome c family protein
MKKLVALLIGAAVVLLVVYHALIYYDNNFRYGRMRETPGVKPHEEPLLIMEAGVVPTSGGEAVIRVTEGKELTSPLPLSDAKTIARGEAVYFTFCAQCHGGNHDGQGTVGQSFQPLPTDLRSPQVQARLPGELFKSVSYGVPNGRQPALHTTITVQDRWGVVAYVKSLGLRD